MNDYKILISIVLLIIAAASVAIGAATYHPTVAICRDVVMQDIVESKQYQAQLDTTLRPDFLDILTANEGGK